MSKWRVRVQSSGGIARVHLFDGEKTIGVVAMPIRSYHEALKEFLVEFSSIAQGVLQENLEKRLWADAQSMTMGLDADAAVKKMQDFGWTREKVESYAKELALILGRQLVEHLPEHLP